MATACRYQAGPATIPRAPHDQGSDRPQLKIVARTSNVQCSTTLVQFYARCGCVHLAIGIAEAVGKVHVTDINLPEGEPVGGPFRARARRSASPFSPGAPLYRWRRGAARYRPAAQCRPPSSQAKKSVVARYEEFEEAADRGVAGAGDRRHGDGAATVARCRGYPGLPNWDDLIDGFSVT
jgi:hypothetical protein